MRPDREGWITGVGAVSPIGLDAPSYVAGLRSGARGVRLLDPLPGPPVAGAPALSTRVVARAWGFEPEGELSGADAERVARQVPLALRAAREALAMAGLAGIGEDEGAARGVGLILGTGGGGIDFTLTQAARLHAGEAPSLWTITNATHGNLAGELSIRLGLRGPSLCVSDGCASSSNALALALARMRAGGADEPRAWVVVGADAHARYETLRGMELLRVIHTGEVCGADEAAGASRPFDRDREGFVLGEGAWAAVVEPASLASERGATRLAELLGAGSTCDAYHRVRPDPEMTECVRAMRLAVADAGLGVEDVGIVHYHGTSTGVNDRDETRAVREAFGGHAERLVGSSIKGAIGHPQGACGIASVVATVGCAAGLDGGAGGAGFVPPTVNLETPDPDCDLDYTPKRSRALTPRAGGHVALVNCLAFGAKNTALVLRVGATG
ncbi:MAG: beta-ketoacyl-[acyl-carrier-protein] synthase family protein [Phycisphaerales bacterium JB040]